MTYENLEAEYAVAVEKVRKSGLDSVRFVMERLHARMIMNEKLARSLDAELKSLRSQIKGAA